MKIFDGQKGKRCDEAEYLSYTHMEWVRMNIDEAAKATRRYYWIPRGALGGWGVYDHATDARPKPVYVFDNDAKAQAACDRLNLAAVLRAIREPSEAMVLTASDAALEECIDGFWCKQIYRSMIDAAIKEVEE